MKRGAETQLTKDNAEDNEIEEVNSSGGTFAKASQSALAGRVLKPLPNRAQAKPPPAVASSLGGLGSSNSSKVEFGAGFKSTGPSNFTFSAPSVPSIPSSSHPSQPSRSTFNFTSQPAATQPSTPSNASKKLTSVLSSTPSSESVSMDLNENDPETPEQNYYVSLRGLNTAFFTAVEICYRRDKFADMGIFFERYKAEFANIEQTLAEGRNLMRPLPRPSAPAKTTNGTASTSSLFGQSAPKPLGPPAAPTSFIFAGTTLKTTTPSSNPSPAFGSGFSPKPATSGPATSSSFSFPASVSTEPGVSPFSSSPVPSKKSQFDSSMVPSKESPFGSSTATPKESLFSTPSSSPFGAPTSNKSSATLSLFSSPGSNTTNPYSSDKPPSTTSTASPSLFGTSTAFGAAGSAPFGAPKASFGSSKPSSGSIDNPVNFPFGGQSLTAPASRTDGNKSTTTPSPFGTTGSTSNVFGSTSTLSSGFSFASSSSSSSMATATAFGSLTKSKTEESLTAESQDSTDDMPASTDGGETPTDDSGKTKILGRNPHDFEGEGEEDEDTLHSVRVKIFRYVEPLPGEPARWAEIGVGNLRLKKNRNDGTYRLLSRNTNHGKLMMNFTIFKGFKTKREKLTMGFTGHHEGKEKVYKLRTKTEGEMTAFQEELDKIIPLLP